jgi:hypothetical protein
MAIEQLRAIMGRRWRDFAAIGDPTESAPARCKSPQLVKTEALTRIDLAKG